MKNILFLIHDLGHGGAEKVLVNLVNNMDPKKFNISVISLFGGGVNEQFLAPHINYRSIFKKSFRGNSHIMKLFSPKQLHRRFIKNKYDIEISYLEGPSARIISGCTEKDTKLVSWIHIEQHTRKIAAKAFRGYNESSKCYQRFDKTICVSKYVMQDFKSLYPNITNLDVLYNTNESKQIQTSAIESVDFDFNKGEIHLVGVARLLPHKGFDRLLRIVKQLRGENFPVHLHILGVGPQKEELADYIKKNCLQDAVTFHGYQTNPYKYVAKCDLFVCASLAEGFSTAATEALIVGTPVCTVEVSGMKEMLGEHNEYGIVTDNNDEALYQGIKNLLVNPELLKHYTEKAIERGKYFSTENTVKAVENMLLEL